ncbi:hypothetical protein BD413DRAFT_583001 [Trametes elegans]|nr:hypothetical protein BD413DRAFT_583001 [Trametes elegans]
MADHPDKTSQTYCTKIHPDMKMLKRQRLSAAYYREFQRSFHSPERSSSLQASSTKLVNVYRICSENQTPQTRPHVHGPQPYRVAYYEVCELEIPMFFAIPFCGSEGRAQILHWDMASSPPIARIVSLVSPLVWKDHSTGTFFGWSLVCMFPV